MSLSSRIVLLVKSIANRFNELKYDVDKKIDASSLSSVAISGSYNDLSNKPSIPVVPVNVSAFNNDAQYLTPNSTLDASKLSVSYLPTAGGKMTGSLRIENGDIEGSLNANSNNIYLVSSGGGNGAYIRLSSQNSSTAGVFSIQARNGSDNIALQGSPNGDLKWNGMEMSSICNPSASYKALSVPASGGSITAPADGWILFVRVSTSSGQLMRMVGNLQSEVHSASSGEGMRLFMPVSKNESVTLTYSAQTTASVLRFYYANGSVWEK